MKRKSWAQAPCPMARFSDLFGDWGALMILREAFGGTTRFDEFQKRLDMSRNLLSARLKRLVEDGIFERRPIADQARRREYVLTEMGEDLVTTIVAMRQWGDRWLFRPQPAPLGMFDAVDGTELAPLKAKSALGREIARADIRLKASKAPQKRAN